MIVMSTTLKSNPMELRDHGSFATIRYYIPGKKARGFWHGHHSADRAVWGWCQLSACKTFWETSRMTGQFDTEDEAVADANAWAEIGRRR